VEQPENHHTSDLMVKCLLEKKKHVFTKVRIICSIRFELLLKPLRLGQSENKEKSKQGRTNDNLGVFY